MSTQLAIVLALLAAAIVMFALNKPRMDAVGLLMLTVLPFTGALTMGEALAGFSDSNVVLIAALFLLMVAVSALGAVMSSTAVTAIFVPVALRIAQKTGTSPSRLMMVRIWSFSICRLSSKTWPRSRTRRYTQSACCCW
jgi:di/tricarboxylate transporter